MAVKIALAVSLAKVAAFETPAPVSTEPKNTLRWALLDFRLEYEYLQPDGV
jgi:hypothetical protein